MLRILPDINEVIVYRKRKYPSIGVIRSVIGDRYSVFTEEGKEMEVEAKRILLSSGIKVGSELTQYEKKLKLRSLRKELEEKRKDIDLRILWEFVEKYQGLLSLEELIKIYFGDRSVENEEILLLFWSLERDEQYFGVEENGFRPRTSKEVDEYLNQLDREKERALQRRAAIDWARGITAGKEEEKGNIDKFRNYIELIKGYIIYFEKFDKYTEAKAYLSEIGIKGIETAIEFLIKIGAWNEHDDPIIKRLGLDGGFSDKSLKEAQPILEQSFSDFGLEDLSNLETYSIDDESTLDIDDALSTKVIPNGIIVGIHIASVANYIPKWSLLDEEAKNRGETIYLPEKVIHMFPTDLVKERFSLVEEIPKVALSLLVQFDEEFNIKSYRFSNSKIIVKKNLSYEKAEQFLNNDPNGLKLVEISRELRQRRLTSGAFILELPDLKIRVDECGSIQIKKNYMNTTPHIVVAEFMILMNWITGRFLRERGIPSIYRSQPERIDEDAWMLDEKDDLYPLKAVKYLRPSRIGTSPEPHCLLGLDIYTQITSPIRRYLDLVLQRQVLGFINGHGFTYTEDELEGLFPIVEAGIQEKKMVEKIREKYWLYRYLRSIQGSEIKGIVSSVSTTNISVYLPDYLIEVPVSISANTKMNEGDVINLRIERVDPLRRKINLIPQAF